MLTRFLQDNSPLMKVARTIVQGALAALVVAIPELVSYYEPPFWVVAAAIPSVMSALAALMAMLGTSETYRG